MGPDMLDLPQPPHNRQHTCCRLRRCTDCHTSLHSCSLSLAYRPPTCPPCNPRVVLRGTHAVPDLLVPAQLPTCSAMRGTCYNYYTLQPPHTDAAAQHQQHCRRSSFACNVQRNSLPHTLPCVTMKLACRPVCASCTQPLARQVTAHSDTSRAKLTLQHDHAAGDANSTTGTNTAAPPARPGAAVAGGSWTACHRYTASTIVQTMPPSTCRGTTVNARQTLTPHWVLCCKLCHHAIQITTSSTGSRHYKAHN